MQGWRLTVLFKYSQHLCSTSALPLSLSLAVLGRERERERHTPPRLLVILLLLFFFFNLPPSCLLVQARFQPKVASRDGKREREEALTRERGVRDEMPDLLPAAAAAAAAAFALSPHLQHMCIELNVSLASSFPMCVSALSLSLLPLSCRAASGERLMTLPLLLSGSRAVLLPCRALSPSFLAVCLSHSLALAFPGVRGFLCISLSLSLSLSLLLDLQSV